MSDATTTSANPASRSNRTLHYSASGARKTLLSLAFVILLPFYVSLPAMLITRASHGLWKDTIGLGILALAFTAIMVILLLQLMHAVRGRVTIGDKAVALTLPRGQGPTPKLRYQSRRIPFEDVQKVEARSEIYGAPLAPVLLRGARIVTRDDDKISLGFVNEHDVDTFPVMTIAETIAERAGIAMADQGAVRRSIAKRAMGKKHAPENSIPLTEEEIAAVNHQHKRVMIGFIAFMALLLVIGMLMDILGQAI